MNESMNSRNLLVIYYSYLPYLAINFQSIIKLILAEKKKLVM